jgi:arsenate reductase
MTSTLYIYSKCSTCQKAVRFLQQHNWEFTTQEITTSPPGIAELERMLAYYEGNIKKLFNTSGLLYRSMNLSEKLPSLSQKEALALLHSNGMLIKRPFLIGDTFGRVGFNEKQWLTLPGVQST